MLSGVLCLMGILGTLWFFLPFLTHHILNIGNITGILVCLVLVFYSLQMSRCHQALFLLWKHTYGKVILSVAGIVFCLVLFLVISFSSFMMQAAATKPQGDVTVIVLGCRVYGQRPSLMLTERMDAAFQYLSAHEEARVILSGGKGSGENISEAECMYRYLTKKGIASSRMYKEEKSTSTRENLLYSKEIIEEEHLSEQIAIVTNEFHEYRAKKTAEGLGLQTSCIAGKTAWWLFPTFYVRELYGILSYSLRGYA